MPEPSLSEWTRDALQRRARGRCECQTRNCTHPREKRLERCTRSLGNDGEAHRITAREDTCFQIWRHSARVVMYSHSAMA
jgi:hypothetical protein